MCEVTSTNFLELLPLIIEQIDRSSFLAIDTEFSSIDTSSSMKTIKEFYQQRSNFIQQITIFQFGLAIFSKTSDQHKYQVTIYNFYLNPTSIDPIDVKYIIQSSSIKFLSQYKFDFNKCFYSGVSFLNRTQENILIDHYQSTKTYRLSINERNFLNVLFEKMNQWLIIARLGDTMEYELNNNQKAILDDYLIQKEIRRCFRTIWTTIKLVDKRKILFIEHITKEMYEERIKDNPEDLQLFIQSLAGFTRLIRYIRDNYRQPIVGHNCFLDWLIIYDKFIDILPSKFDDFQQLMNKNFVCSIFDTKYLALEMKEYLFTRQNRSNISNYVDNLTTSTSLSSLYDLLTSKYYENLIFFKPIIQLNATDRYQDEVWEHEASYDAYMSGVVFLKLIYLYQQKKCKKIQLNEHQSLFDICLNEVQIFKNRFYAIFTPYVSLNRYDAKYNLKKKLQQCLVVEKHSQEQLDISDIISRFNSYCSMEYEMNRNLTQIYLSFQSEHCQRRILKDYLNHPLYKIEQFHWFKHSLLRKYSVGIMSLVVTGICIFLLVKRRM